VTDLTAEQAMRQSWMTAHDAMMNAKTDVSKLFGPLKPEVANVLVAAYMNAAALDFLAWTVVRATDNLERALGDLGETLKL
jgi:hypothetical protein